MYLGMYPGKQYNGENMCCSARESRDPEEVLSLLVLPIL